MPTVSDGILSRQPRGNEGLPVRTSRDRSGRPVQSEKPVERPPVARGDGTMGYLRKSTDADVAGAADPIRGTGHDLPPRKVWKRGIRRLTAPTAT